MTRNQDENRKKPSGQKAAPARHQAYHIQRKFQATFIFRFCFVALGAMVLSSVILYLQTRDTLITTFAASELAVRDTFWVIFPNLIITNLIVLACFFVATVVLTRYMSHRIGVPLQKMEEMIDLLADGNFNGRVSFREGDPLKGIEPKFNHMIDGLNNRVRQIRTEVEEIKAITQSRKELPEEAKAKIEKLDEVVHQVFDI